MNGRHVFAALLFVTIVSSVLFAEEVRVVDERGLIRAVRVVDGEAMIAVDVAGTSTRLTPEGTSLSAEQIDALGKPPVLLPMVHHASKKSLDRALFLGPVKDGTWRLSSPWRMVRRVRILPVDAAADF